LIEAFVDILYPRRCPVCGDIVKPRGELACPSCRKKLTPIDEPRCKKCSKPIESVEKEYCHDCETKEFHYVKGYALWTYDALLKKSIADFKFHGRKEYCDFYIEEIIKQFGAEIKRIAPDVLVPVPLHRSKQAQRGYNQADILAKGIGDRLNIAVISHLLKRNKKTIPQKQLNDRERLRNLEKAFTYSNEESRKFPGIIRKVLLIDDIYTTGSTIEACTKVLLSNGIDEVYFLSICIGKGF
jgi:ComF family protein